MISLRIVFHILGWVIAWVGVMMFVPIAADMHHLDWEIFGRGSAITAFVGISMILTTRQSGTPKLNYQQAYLVVVLGWILVALFGAIPFLEMGISFSDSVFETMSGITTTGSTVLTGLDQMPPNILLWRAILQWIGGIGIIAIAVLILPFLRVGGMQLFKIESSGSPEDKAASVMKTLFLLGAAYIGLTATCALLFDLFGMSAFDAITHAMTTLSTGGYSSYDASFGHFKDLRLHWIAILFMILAAVPFFLYVRMFLGDRRALFRDAQVRGFVGFLVVASLGMTYWLMTQRDVELFRALTLTAFNITSVVTTTGFVSDDYTAWGPGAVGMFLVLSFIGGCSGSTSGAIKIYRFQILFIFVRSHIKRLFSPNRVLPLKYNGRLLPNDVPLSVLAFLVVFVATIALFTVVLTLLGLDLVTAYSASVTAITNVGPGLGTIVGPAGNFQVLPDAAKWALIFAMLAGRLEVLVLLVALEPDFWRA
ncbi:MAG: TrkH family potassium uptake protein [Hyphomicrobiales bacterium]|nr:TrkH family potassium uptake protein [Hyphomicrobiales bacterium]MCP5370590.1 TrkH family potassium uptake protein [Hyphomicrobiales bacterium]